MTCASGKWTRPGSTWPLSRSPARMPAGAAEAALKAARTVNNSMVEQQRVRPDRIRWFASLPFQHAEDARAELARCAKLGAVGVMVIANFDGEDLTNRNSRRSGQRSTSWMAGAGASGRAAGRARTAHGRIQHDSADRIHGRYHTRLHAHIYSEFLDKYPNIKFIPAHGGATLPCLAGRLDSCWEMIPGLCRTDQRKAFHLSATHLVRRGGVRPAGAGVVHFGGGNARPRTVRFRLSPQYRHRRHGGMPGTGERAAGRSGEADCRQERGDAVPALSRDFPALFVLRALAK